MTKALLRYSIIGAGMMAREHVRKTRDGDDGIELIRLTVAKLRA
jgi:hypothetical protein